MASCDDDFSLLAADDHHLHQFASHHRYAATITNENVKVSSSAAADGSSENGGVFEVNPYETTEFESHESDPKNSRVCVETTTTDKRKERERDDVSDGSFKKTKPLSSSGGVMVPCGGGGGGCGGGEYRKDREEWSDTAIECLLDAYTEKYTQLNRGNLRGRDWEDVAAIVSERCENQSKSVEQCKNKVDNLKKRYKLERHRMSSASVAVSHWPWFKKMEAIVANSLPAKSASDDDKISVSGGGGGVGAGRQQKR